MNSKVVGSESALEYLRNAQPGDRSVYVNMDAIRNLPDLFEVVVSTIKYDPNNLEADFDNVGGEMWMPKTAMMYKIAEAAGFSGGERVISEPLVQLANLNMIQCKAFDAPPNMAEMLVGHKVTKYGEVLQEDGTVRRSSAHASEYNVYERCCELWSAEEKVTKGYNEVRDGEYAFYGKKKTGRHYINSKGYAAELKYDDPWKRNAHFYAEMKFAQSKADTKAWMKCVRELAGMLTGYNAKDLNSGIFIFSRVRRSGDSLKMEHAAKLTAMSRGALPAAEATSTLFGEAKPTEKKTEAAEPVPAERPPEESDYDLMKRLVEAYLSLSSFPEGMKPQTSNMLKWLTENSDSADITQEPLWDGAVKVIKAIEETLPAQDVVAHRDF